ncbi:MAG: DUF2855 family protein [Rhodobacteraceae bacterium]|nr:DUF2855 family protein [Paracoccaceae bacterium]
MPSNLLTIRKDNIRNISTQNRDLPPLADGEALLAIEGFALTANNVTYAATGTVLKYWDFFPCEGEGQGIVPVWGFATVTESRAPSLAKGSRLYGFLPAAAQLVIRPEARGASAVVDTAAHRAGLSPVYNTYMRAEPASIDDDARRAIFNPLIATSYLLYDFLADNGWFGAEQVIIGSASSKTGLGLCHFLAQARPDGPEVIGLTAARNRDFVASLGTCDQVVTYDKIDAGIAKRPSVFVDMAGSADIRARLHSHLGDNMRHSAAVGTSHWDQFRPTGDLPGARPTFFFAPAQIEKRRNDWGKGEVEARLDAAWRAVAASSRDWLTIEMASGLAEAVPIWGDIADGKVPPATGHYIRV